MTSEVAKIRADLKAAISAGDMARATMLAGGALRTDASLPTVSAINNEFTSAASRLTPLRVALLSSFSIEFVQSFLKAYGFAVGLAIEIYQAGFGSYAQEILNRDSGLYAFSPEITILAVEGRDVAPQMYERFHETILQADAAIAEVAASDLSGLAAELRKSSDCMILVHNFTQPVYPALGIADAQFGGSQRAAVARFNAQLAESLREIASAYVVDAAALCERVGALSWFDWRMAHYARAPIALPTLKHLAQEHMRFIRAKCGRSKKCLVLDLDNTLWGGVLGEDGPSGVGLGASYPGSAFVSFQHAILTLNRRGVLLAIASKNNEADVNELMARHPHMVLKPEHFAASEIHWGEKPESLKAIAARLNIALEHMVFVDDNPVECEQMMRVLPQVTTLLLPAQPELYANLLFAEGWFDVPSLSAEDMRRGGLYKSRGEAESLRAQATNLEEFYHDLKMRIIFEPVTPASLVRAAQLTQKTNQFNATTRRLTEAEVRSRAESDNWLCLTVKVIDRFGDNGIVGLILARNDGEFLAIDTFLLSCRVIGRTVETSMLACLYEEAKARGLPGLRGEIIPTAKNLPVRDVFQRHGFVCIDQSADGCRKWEYGPAQPPLEQPDWFDVEKFQATSAAGR